MYTSIDIGSHSIKIVVSEKVEDKFYVLASTKVRSMGIKKGVIKDHDLVLNSLNEAIANINSDLGIDIKKVLLSFPMFQEVTSIETGDIEIDHTVTGGDIKNVIKKAINENISNHLEVLYVEPIVFEVDGDLQVIDPKGLTTSHLKVRCAVSTMEKDVLYEYLSLLDEAGLEVVDVTYGVVGDYFYTKNRDLNKQLGVLVDIGYGKTEIAVFNKGILLKGKSIPIGSGKIDKDISYIYKLDKKNSIDIKENFGMASSKYADKYDILEISNISGDRININQLEVSQVIEARLIEILKNVKNEINSLTNREISYIIITGGITNLSGFPYVMEEEFPMEKVICNMTALGVRSNVYSACYGISEYFDNKMVFRDTEYTMFSDEDIKKIISKKKKFSTKDTFINKLESYIRD